MLNPNVKIKIKKDKDTGLLFFNDLPNSCLLANANVQDKYLWHKSNSFF